MLGCLFKVRITLSLWTEEGREYSYADAIEALSHRQTAARRLRRPGLNALMTFIRHFTRLSERC